MKNEDDYAFIEICESDWDELKTRPRVTRSYWVTDTEGRGINSVIVDESQLTDILYIISDRPELGQLKMYLQSAGEEKFGW